MPGRPWTLLPTPGAERHQGVFAPFSRLYGSRRRAGTDVFFMQKEDEKMKKRVISLLLALVLAVSLLPTAAWAAETGPKGKGTADDPYLIEDAEDLAKVTGSGHYALANDIDLTDTKYAGKSITPALSDAFSGTFDGNRHTISGLCINTKSKNGVGLFGTVNGASIQNLKVEGSVTGTNSGFVGGIVGKTQGNVTITNCSFTGSVSATKSGSSNGAGGIVGRVNAGTLKVENCANHATVTAEKASAAGIIGHGGTNEVTITNCYNDGAISGQWYPSGICAQNTNDTSTIQECFNSGSISNTNGGTYCAGISANFKGEAPNCYRTEPGSENVGNNKNGTSILLKNSDAVKNELTDIGFLVSDDGKVSLPWETSSTPAEKNPRITISGNKTMNQTTDGSKQSTTLEAKQVDIDDAQDVEWTIESGADVIELEQPAGANEHNSSIIVKELQPGLATIRATAGDYIATADIRIIPYISALELNGTPAAGEKYKVTVNILDGKLYDEEKYGKLTGFKWTYSDNYYDTTTATSISGDGMEIMVPAGTEGKHLSVSLYTHGQNMIPNSIGGYYKVIEDSNSAALSNDKADLTIPTEDIKAPTTLELPLSGKRGSAIVWTSSDPDIISDTGVVTLPQETATVTLTATLTYNGKTEIKTFTIKVWSQAAVDAEGDSEKIEAAIGKLSTLQPQFGKDSNVQTMVETRLANAGFSGVGVMYTGKTPMSATEKEAHSDISENGNITYFYTDLTTTDLTTTLQRFDTYKASFMLTCGRETKTVEIWVTVYWDADKVRDFMTKEVLDQTTLPELTEKNLTLPASGKWTTISWTSSDPTIIANDGTITRSTIDQQAVLTATFTFNFTSDVTGNEQPIVLYKVFEVTVKGNADAADRAALYQQKLNDALAAPGLKDFVTGAKLTADANGVYTTSNDIQFPTTRDLKIDGKYTPVVITSSDPGVIEAPTTPNSARVWVYRPLPGESAKTVTLTMKILDRPNGPQPGDDLSAMRVLASKEIKVTVQPLTQDEIKAEIALMERVKVKVNYWNGIRNANTDQNNVTTDLHAFQECYLNDNGELTWVYDRKHLKNHGIVPVPLDNWYDQQIWRLFRSSNADVVAHENLLVTRQGDSKAVTITSYLSSETLGRYAEKYPQNADFQKLYKQPVTIDLVVTGTQYAQGVSNTVRMQAAKRALAVRPTVTVSFSLSGRGMGFAEESNLKYAEGSTVYDVFSDLLAKHRYTCKRRGSYIAAITSDSGVTLEEFDEGKNSGWMYRVNGVLVGRYMSAQGLEDGDRIELYFTSDWTSEPGAEGWQKPGKIETIVNADGSVTKIETKSDGTVIETTTWRDGSTLTAETSPNGRVETVEKRADGTTVETVEPASGGITASVSVPKSVGSTRVDIPVSKPTGSMVAVIVHPDGTEEIVRGSVVTETGIALRAEGDVRLKIIDNAKRFNDMADHWAKDAVEFASSRELFNGVGNDAFGPDLSMTRGMVSTVLARLAGADTAGGETWYAKGTVWAVENGISDGTNPEQPVTREQLAAMLYRYAGSPAVSGELGFDDADSISAWARDAVRWCVDNGILNGVGGNRMTPQDLARRGQVAAMLMRFLQATV